MYVSGHIRHFFVGKKMNILLFDMNLVGPISGPGFWNPINVPIMGKIRIRNTEKVSVKTGHGKL
jgi:hypothetical protein